MYIVLGSSVSANDVDLTPLGMDEVGMISFSVRAPQKVLAGLLLACLAAAPDISDAPIPASDKAGEPKQPLWEGIPY